MESQQKEKGQRKYLQEKNKAIFYMFICQVLRNKVSELLAGECLEYDL